MLTGQQVRLLVLMMLWASIVLAFWFGLLHAGGVRVFVYTLAAVGAVSVVTAVFTGCGEIIEQMRTK